MIHVLVIVVKNIKNVAVLQLNRLLQLRAFIKKAITKRSG